MTLVKLHCLLFIVLASTRGCSSLDLFINGVNGNDNDDCNHKHPCRSLDHVANLSTKLSQNISIKILQSVLLKSLAVFYNVMDLSIAGSDENDTRVTVSCGMPQGHKLRVGILFNRSANITLQSFTIANCGEHFFYPHEYKYKQAVMMYDVKDLTVHNMTFINNTGCGLLVINSGGVIEVSWSHFINNSICNCTYSGGGMIIVISNNRMYNHSIFSIIHSTFYKNYDHFPYKKCYHAINYVKKGGGLWIDIFKSTNNRFLIYNCTFEKNSAKHGGGLYLQASSTSSNNLINVSRCRFHGNRAIEGGGGTDIGTSIGRKHYRGTPKYNNFTFTDCNFTNNAALYGGGVALFSSPGDKILNNVSFHTCIFLENEANGGAAVDLNRDRYNTNGNLFITSFSFHSCNFTKNKAGQLNGSISSKVTQSGVVFTREINVSFHERTSFENNINTAIYSASAAVTFIKGSVVTFIGNTGERGGAILLVGNAQLSLSSRTNITFKGNTATFGGAICAIPLQTHFLYFTDICFIDPQGMASIVFDSNKATTGIADDIFVSTLLPCRKYCHKSCYKNLSYLFVDPGYLANFTFQNHSFNSSSSVATAAKSLNSNSNHTQQIFPGIPYHINIDQYDEFRHKITSLYPLSARLLTPYKEIGLITNSATLANNTIVVVGDINANGTIILETTALSSIQLAVNITIVPCPAGYYLSGNACHCSGSGKSYDGITHCYANYSASIIIGLWAGYYDDDDDHKFYTGVCATELCSYQGNSTFKGHYVLPLTNDKEVLEREVCAKNRQGILCGKCTKGTSTYYLSPLYTCDDSTSCKYGIPLYIVLELFPVTVIFLIILFFDIRLTSGAFYTFIFYAQFLDTLYINAFSIIHLEMSRAVVAYVYQAIYGIFNFEMLNAEPFSFCLWPNATVLHLFMIKYVTTLYALLLILLTVAILKVNSLYTCIKLCHRLGRRDIRGSIINALSAFIVLCYSQCVRVTFSILIRIKLVSIDNNFKYVPLFDGELEYMKGEHLYFAFPAFLCLIFIILPPPIVLLCEPLLIKVSSLLPNRLAYWLRKLRMMIKPFLDSFQGCFKDKCRVFAGLFFLYRIVLFLPYIYSGSVALDYVSAQFLLFLILLIHCLVQPFQRKWHNYLDLFLLINLIAINMLTITDYFSTLWDSYQLKINKTSIVTIQLCLIALPLMYIFGYFGFQFYQFIKIRLYQRVTQAPINLPAPSYNTTYKETEESLPARLLDENMLSLSYGTADQ